MAHIKQVTITDEASYLIEPTLYANATVSNNGKTYSASFNENFELIEGVCIQIKCPNQNNTAPTTLNTKAIYYNGSAIESNILKADHTYALVYDGTQWQLIGDIDTNTTYTNGTGLNLSGTTFSVKYGNEAGTAVQGNDARLSDARTPLSHTHGNITNEGAIGSGNNLVVTSNGTIQAGASISSTISSQTQTTAFLREDGAWAAPSYTFKLFHPSSANNLKGTTGNFVFYGNSLFPDVGSGYDWIGLQVGYSADKWQLAGVVIPTAVDGAAFQLTGLGNHLYFRQNDSGGTNTSNWKATVSLLDSGMLINDYTINSGDSLIIKSSAEQFTIKKSSITFSATITNQDQTSTFLRSDGTWAAPSYSTGTVTSVQVAASDPLQSSTGTASSTTLSTTISFKKQNANTILAGPSSGSTTAVPTFRNLVIADLPTITVEKGGTNITSYAIGDILYASASDTLSKLAGNTTTTRKFLRSVATTEGTAVAPVWDIVTKEDIELDNVTNHAQVTSLSYNTTTHKLTYKVSDGNDIEIATFGSHAEDSTDYLPLSGGDMSGTINRYYSTASTNPMITLRSNNQNITLFQIGHATSITGTMSSYYKLLYVGENNNPKNYLQLIAYGSSEETAIQIDQNGLITIPQRGGFTYTGIEMATTSLSRPIWFSATSSSTTVVNGRPVYSSDFKFNPATNTITIGTGTLSATNYSGNSTTATAWENSRTVYVDLETTSTTTTINGGASNAAAIALGIDGILGIANGGTGISTINPHYVLIGPASGANSAAPTWRSLSNDDLPGSGAITIAQIPVSLGGSISLSDLNLANALHFVGTTTTTIADNDTTATIIINGDNYSPSQGDVVLTSDGEEFLWNGSRWDLLGDASSFKKVQSAVTTSTASGSSTTTFVSSVTQDSEGVITVNTSTLDTSGAWGGNAASATVLETSRTLWGQSFNGSSNITGDLTDVGPNFKLPSNENDFYFLKSDGTTEANGYFGTVYATTFSGTASNVTTTASTDTFYLVGVKSNATSALLHDISITASADVLTIGKLTITGGTTNSSIASDGTLTINNTTQALNLQTTSAALTISTQNGNLEAKSTGSGTVKLTGTTGAMTISTTSGALNIETTSGNTAIDSGGTVSISSASGKTITISSGSTLYLNKPTTSSIVFTSGSASTSNEIARFNINGKFQLKDDGTQNTHELYVNGDSAFNGKIVFGTQTSNSINENAYMQWNATDQSIDFLFA